MALESVLAHVELDTRLPVAECASRLHNAVDRHARIDRRRWGTERCLGGEVAGTELSLNVDDRYVGGPLARNSWKTGFRGKLVERGDGATLRGDFGFLYMQGSGSLWLLRPFGIVVMAAAILLGLQGLIGGRLDDLLALPLALPGLGLVLATPWLQRFVLHRAADDERLLRAFLSELLQAGSPGQIVEQDGVMGG